VQLAEVAFSYEARTDSELSIKQGELYVVVIIIVVFYFTFMLICLFLIIIVIRHNDQTALDCR
jgi:cytochrome bd-type quinol oxidase subunit 1